MKRESKPLALALLLAACGSTTPEPEDATAIAAPTAPSDDRADEPAKDATKDAEAAGTAPEAPTSDDSAAPTPDDDAPTEREITYRVTPAGLIVEVEGASLLLTAEPVKRADGWGLRLDAEVSSMDGRTHRLLVPDRGIFAFRTLVERARGREAHPDVRKGDDERLVTPGDEVVFSREWPGADQAGARPGDSVTIDVGLWGIAREAEQRRPLKKLALLRMVVGKGAPKVAVDPPEK